MAQKDNKSKLAQGERQLTEALAMKRLLVGAEHAEIATGLFNMGDFLRHCDRLVEAEQPLKDAYAMRSRVFGPQHKDTIHSAGALADLLMDLRRYAEAEPLHRLELEFRRADREAPEYELYLAASLRSVGTDLLYQNKFAEAEPLLRESLELRDKVLKPRDRRRFQSMTLLGGALAGMGRFDDARKLLQDGYDGLKTATGARQHHWREATEMMARYYDYTGQPQAADEWRAKLAKYGAAEPNDDNGER